MVGTMQAWVESPLQLLGVLEHAGLEGAGIDAVARQPAGFASSPIVVHPRAGDAQLESTAATLHRLLERGEANESRRALVAVDIALERRVMPAARFVDGGDWMLGDPFSGQVQARLARAVPRSLTLVDDGAITRHLAELLASGRPLLRPGAGLGHSPLVRFRRSLADRASRVLRDLAHDHRLEVTTYLTPDDPAVEQLRSIGARVRSHRFDVTRTMGHAAAAVPAGAVVVLGTAAVVDGAATAASHLDWVAEIARTRLVAYAPHRREPEWMLRTLRRIPRVHVLDVPVPIELALAATQRPLDIVSRPSTAIETLELVLRGTGSTVQLDPMKKVLA